MKSKSTLSISPETLDSLKKLGSRIRANRASKNWTIEQMCEKLFCSHMTYKSIEAGKPTVNIGLVWNALWVLGLSESIENIAPVPETLNYRRRIRKSPANGGQSISENDRDF